MLFSADKRGLAAANAQQQGAKLLMKMARETGLEPAASAVTGRRSNQLSYSRGCRNQGSDPRRKEGIKAYPPLVKAIEIPDLKGVPRLLRQQKSRPRAAVFVTPEKVSAYWTLERSELVTTTGLPAFTT